MTVPWTREHLAQLDDHAARTGVLEESQTVPAIADLSLWDLWPIRSSQGATLTVDGTEYWMALSAPRERDPEARHNVARLRLLAKQGPLWSDRGVVFPDGATPGSREWAGSADFDERGATVTVRYTATGQRGEPAPTFSQRLMEATASFDPLAELPLSNWSPHSELVTQGGPYTSTLDQRTGTPGSIKAFRDPSVFVDPQTDRQYLLFTASLASSRSDFNGTVGLATRNDGSSDWQRQPPVVHADGVNNEMERPHVVHRGGLYYLFFSTQAHTFDSDVSGPTGLYGFVADSMEGEWAPLNRSGLVLRNPIEEPHQCYSWLVLDDRRVVSFVNLHGLRGRHPEEVEAAGALSKHFGGTPAPFEQITLHDDRSKLVTPATPSPAQDHSIGPADPATDND
ncbi:MAG: glycoside hydrolase family 68 protein [Acidimicrobiales bacterium]|nr:glycoside hydrolase family 68 protein [Acidimicrobiales bacterium]